MTDELYHTATDRAPDNPPVAYTDINRTHPIRGYDNGEAYAGDTPTYRGQMCSPSAHYFECKHEVYCACGRTQRRTELQMDSGL